MKALSYLATILLMAVCVVIGAEAIGSHLAAILGAFAGIGLKWWFVKAAKLPGWFKLKTELLLGLVVIAVYWVVQWIG